MKSNRYNAQRVAYELWCIQEDRRDAGQPVESLSALILQLRERHPRLDEAVIDQGVTHFLARMFEENTAQIVHRRAWIARISQQLCRRREGSSPVAEEDCARAANARYNRKNMPTPKPGAPNTEPNTEV